MSTDIDADDTHRPDWRSLALGLGVALLGFACSEPPAGATADTSGPRADGSVELGVDAGADASPSDTGPLDTGPLDTGPLDTQGGDTTPPRDSSPGDASDSSTPDAPGDTTDAETTTDTSTDAAPEATGGPCRRGDAGGGDAGCISRSCATGYRLAPNGRCLPRQQNVPTTDTSKIATYTSGSAGQQLLTLPGDKVLAYPFLIDLTKNTQSKPMPTNGHQTRVSVWIDGGVAKQAHTHKQDVNARSLAMSSLGNKLWNAGIYGCCNYLATRTVALKPSKAKGYVKQKNALFEIDLKTGNSTGIQNSGSGPKGHVLLDGDAAYTIGVNAVTKVDIAQGIDRWAKNFGASTVSDHAHGALTGQGDPVVAFRDGTIVHLDNAVGSETWGLPKTAPVAASAGPQVVVDQNDRVFVTTGAPAIWAIDAASGQVAWKQFLPAEAHELLVGDKGRLYAYAPNVGRIYAFDRTTGRTLHTYVGLWGPTGRAPFADLLLKDGSLIALSRGNIVVFPVTSEKYPSTAAWPVQHHDNQRTSNLDAPLKY